MDVPESSGPNTERSKSRVLLVLVVLTVVALWGGTYFWQQRKIDQLDKQVVQLNAQLGTQKNQSDDNTYTSEGDIKVKVYSPKSSAKVVSPLAIVGEVPGSWSFEASFPVELKDAKGSVIAKASAQVLGDWMTDQLVPFSVKLEYSEVVSGDGTLVLQKDNPSGLAENDDTVSIPVKF